MVTWFAVAFELLENAKAHMLLFIRESKDRNKL
jgi:hypothetical protein